MGSRRGGLQADSGFSDAHTGARADTLPYLRFDRQGVLSSAARAPLSSALSWCPEYLANFQPPCEFEKEHMIFYLPSGPTSSAPNACRKDLPCLTS